ncbi:HD domain-containing protein [Photobacterium sp. CCB-ST2H9]|nr:HD domain-containing protein [Photobacterium sp. CCB-ST2H9]UTM59527.1 HD domain-containing protein [Photobacterium sp. CCB-ST2H9]
MGTDVTLSAAQLHDFERQFLAFIQREMKQDLAHDMNHVSRVVRTAKSLCRKEQAIAEVVVPAAYLHDCFSYGKEHPKRRESSSIAAGKAVHFLEEIGYPVQYLNAIHHAIVAHSFSANVLAQTLEAQIVQDADRLDALGAIGIARCVQVSSSLGRALYEAADPFCGAREPDDGTYTIDHFYRKLFRLSAQMNTPSGREEATRRTQYMRDFLQQLQGEIDSEFVVPSGEHK